jgi:glycosyltransferase involved in cell wall biosynthesis
MFSPCVVVPVYDHQAAVGTVVREIIAQNVPCILIDDGSAAPCAAVLDALAAGWPQQIKLIRHARNRGKGAAVLSGMRYAAEAGYSHVVQIDADGQHQVADITRFIEHAATAPNAVIVGRAKFDGSVPRLRYGARYLTHLWVMINTLSRQIQDSMCGFRVYPLAAVMELDRTCRLGERMSFDIEVLVRLYWAGVTIVNLPTPVRYPEDGCSHFRGLLDNYLISRLHATLFFGMLRRLPFLVARRWSLR